MNFQWYPGHMTKAKRQMQEDIKLIDLVIELVDARIPLSSRNPDIDELGKNKYRLILMNKADLADKERTREWSAFFKEKGFFVVSLDARSKSGMKSITDIVMEACKEKIERDRKRGIKNRPVRAMVVGIPNVGKSTFINSYAGKACAKTGNKPGVTKGKQWIRLNKSVELLDTPGILWPKFEDQQVEFQRIQKEFYDEVVYSDKGPGAEEYKKYYESMDPATAEYIYKQVVTQLQESKEVQDYAAAYSSMKPKQAAAIFEKMTNNLDLAARILKVMSADDRGAILGAMDSEVAAKITKIMDPES